MAIKKKLSANDFFKVARFTPPSSVAGINYQDACYNLDVIDLLRDSVAPVTIEILRETELGMPLASQGNPQFLFDFPKYSPRWMNFDMRHVATKCPQAVQDEGACSIESFLIWHYRYYLTKAWEAYEERFPAIVQITLFEL